MIKHTPGTWTTVRFPLIGEPFYIESTERAMEMVVIKSDEGQTSSRRKEISFEEAEANAKLIAAAPEMLTALIELTKRINLGKLNVKKDFELLVYHAAATKAIYNATN